MKARLAQLRTFARRPFVQLCIFLALTGAAAGSFERLVIIYRDGTPVSFGVILAHLSVVILYGLAVNHWERIERRMKRGDRAEEREARLRARMAQILQGR